LEKILVSACLLGNKVRYNGSCLSISESDLKWLNANFELVAICPEVSSGLTTPRAPAEIIGGEGVDVIGGSASVVGDDGIDVTTQFLVGARNALEICQQQNIKYAILAEASPSCGSSKIYDGSFQGVKVDGSGVTAALLEANEVRVFSQHSIAMLRELLHK